MESCRFIPNRNGMDMSLSQYALSKENVAPAENTEKLAQAIFGDSMKGENKILSYKSKAPATIGNMSNHSVLYSSNVKHAAIDSKASRFISQKAERVLDAPGIIDDYYLNLIDWGTSNVLAIALSDSVYLWNASTGSTSELMTSKSGNNICSVNWTEDGKFLSIGLNDGIVQLWDVERQKVLRNLKGHSARVGSLSWNKHILSTGSKDTTIINHDVRISEHILSRLSGHSQEVCGLKWNFDGTQLASGANDNIVNIWDATASTPKFTFNEHNAAVKALAWAPFEKNLLATGAGSADRCIRFYNTNTGALLNTIDTQSQVSSLVWSKDPSCKEIVSSHGLSNNQICVWKYPSLARTAELRGHSSRIISMAQSPDGTTIASASADESLRFWKVFDEPQTKQSSKKIESGSGISSVRQIR